MDLVKLKALRDQLDVLDASLISAMAQRQTIVAEIGRTKEAAGKQLRDFKREAEVLAHVRSNALAAQLDPALAESVMKLLIGASLTQQEQKRIQNAGVGAARRALIIGGNGKMGRWFAGFLDALGFSVEINDPSGTPEGFAASDHWQASAQVVDLIVVATPIGLTAAFLGELARIQTQALIFDIGSLKSPLKSALRHAAQAGLQICSVHPMFGPDTQLLSDRHILLMDAGNRAAVDAAKALFGVTSAQLVDIDLDQHDELIAFVLGLSHAVNIVFAAALADSGAAAPLLAQLSSTTFDRQLEVASRVVQENPALYFEIQHLNDAREHSLQALEKTVQRFAELVRSGDIIGFTALMQRGKNYLAERN
jgi:chorismate mutase / prephenate dehydrogenase